MRRIGRLGAVVLAAALTVAGCASAGDEPADELATEEDQGVADADSDIQIDADLWPLTGSPRGGGDASLPVLAAKIDNHPLARPQVGLDSADIVFEELVEGGITRYVAMWHSDVPTEIGPVRSVRPMDPDIVSPFGGILAYSGGQQRFIEAMLDAPVASAINGQSDVEDFFYRTNDKVAPHNVIVRAPELVSYFQDRDGPPPQFNYAIGVDESSAVTAGAPLSSLRVGFSSFSSPTWQWSEDDGAFLRNQTNGAPDNAVSGARLQAANVLVLQVRIDVIQDIPTTQLVSAGTGVVATGGHVLDIEWSKASSEAPIELTDSSGARVLMAPGQTWVELIPDDQSGVPAGSITIE